MKDGPVADILIAMLCLVVALRAEARPLIAHYKLQAMDGHPYRLYGCEHVRLVISGIGKVASAAAVAYQRAILGNTSAAWLNIGIAGHHSKAVGSALLVHKIIDVGNGETFYPMFTAPPACPTTLLHTVEKPDMDYSTDCAYDMEASGFFATAHHFASRELVHALKIISDNPHSPIENGDLKKSGDLIAAQLAIIDQSVVTLQELSHGLTSLQADPPALGEIGERWHFSATQRHLLRDLLQRWQVLMPNCEVLDDQLLALQKSREVLRHLERRVAAADLTLC